MNATDHHLDIVKAFKSSLSHIDWMDKKSANAAAEKVHDFSPSQIGKKKPNYWWQATVIRIKVGYPLSPDTRDPKDISQYYGQVHIDKYNFFENILQAA